MKNCNDANHVQGSGPEENAKTMLKILNGRSDNSPEMLMVLANAAAGIVLGGIANTFIEGVQLAEESIQTGKAYRKLKELIQTEGGNIRRLENLEAKCI